MSGSVCEQEERAGEAASDRPAVTAPDHDVLVVGLGPVGTLLAHRLTQAGLSVLAVDRAVSPYPLPRAIALDDEVQELLSRCEPALLEPMLHDQPVRFVSRGRTLGEIRFPRTNGFSGLSFFHQPTLEAGLAALLTCEVRRGVALTGLTQDGTGVTASLGADHVRTSWLVGCDGAGSTVRGLAGVAWRGRDLPHRWHVVDCEGDAGRAGFTYTCEPELPTVDMPMPGGHRWEFLLRGGAVPPALPLPVVRATDYSYGTRHADRWQVGRVLLAGDAAHTMPPFAGQGLGAGLRDAWALGQLLPQGDVMRYQPLRARHVREMTRLSLLVGAVLQARHGTRLRDALLHQAFRSPGLGPWLGRGGPRRPRSGVLEL
ncbi:MAG TPA: FAD-dependent monooxygenase [Mycobacteriales bacterium]|nr:FAD-dependent monooxygenase [Mycobacteriales bacterium]